MGSKEEHGKNRPLRFRLELDPTHSYLTERGLTSETVKEFEIGYCSRGVMAQRIAFPIYNVSGELVGYAGRWPGDPPDGRPKYRLPDGFKKSQEIFRMSKALQEDAELPVVIVEGFFDVMRLWQLGIRRSVALMGSSMSEAARSGDISLEIGVRFVRETSTPTTTPSSMAAGFFQSTSYRTV